VQLRGESQHYKLGFEAKKIKNTLTALMRDRITIPWNIANDKWKL